MQVEERRTPLQRSMDELAKKLSILSFGVIGVICLIGVLQQRPWLDMFTIGGNVYLGFLVASYLSCSSFFFAQAQYHLPWLLSQKVSLSSRQ